MSGKKNKLESRKNNFHEIKKIEALHDRIESLQYQNFLGMERLEDRIQKEKKQIKMLRDFQEKEEY